MAKRDRSCGDPRTAEPIRMTDRRSMEKHGLSLVDVATESILSTGCRGSSMLFRSTREFDHRSTNMWACCTSGKEQDDQVVDSMAKANSGESHARLVNHGNQHSDRRQAMRALNFVKRRAECTAQPTTACSATGFEQGTVSRACGPHCNSKQVLHLALRPITRWKTRTSSCLCDNLVYRLG